MILLETKAAYWRIGTSGPITPIPSVVGWSYEVGRVINPGGSYMLPRELNIRGVLYLRDHRQLDVLADTLEYGKVSSVFVYVVFRRSGEGQDRVKGFWRVAWCAGPGGGQVFTLPGLDRGLFPNAVRLPWQLTSDAYSKLSDNVMNLTLDELPSVAA